jgi:molybdopterin-containing oxidoreductase family membrane subunit
MENSIIYPKIRIGKRMVDPFPYWLAFLGSLIIFGLVGVFFLFRDGLQVTGLSNRVPWGLWISIDLSSIALGGSAFVFGAMVYILQMKKYEAVGKLAVLLGFLGYSSAGLILLMDLGQPLRFWHPVIFWQPHSLLWEVTMCVVLYLTVLIIEMLPIILEHPIFNDHPWWKEFPFLSKIGPIAKTITHYVHKFGMILAILGMTLSLLHQASLGATYAVLYGRGIWFNQSAPTQFVFSAMSGGISLLFILSVFVFRVMRPGTVKDEILYNVARLAGAVTLLLTYLKVWDWAVSNYYSFNEQIALQTELLNKIAPYSLTFWLGQALFPAIAGAVLLVAKKVKNLKVLIAVAVLPVVSTIITRWNYNFSGLIGSTTYDPYTPIVRLNSYTPTWVEFAVGGLVIAYWMLAFSLATRYLPFGSHDDHGHH